MDGPFAQDVEVNSNLFVLSPNSKHLVSGGHWDNSFRVHSVEKNKLLARISHHNGMLRCGGMYVTYIYLNNLQ